METAFDTSVIIPCYNVGKTLELQLECLFYQKDADPFEVIIVDNKSTDNTVEVARSWASKLNIRIVEASEHAGVSYARNRGIQAARGSKLLFLDGDDAAAENFVMCGQRTLDEVPIYVAGFDPIDVAEFDHGREHIMGLIASKVLEYRSPLFREIDRNWPILPGGSFGILKSIILELGGFDLTFEPGAEDNELAIRAIVAGYELPVQRSTTIAYRVDSRRQRSLNSFYKGAKSSALLATVAQRWSFRIKQDGHPLKNLAKTLASTPKYLFASDRRNWLVRLAKNLGISVGFVEYAHIKRLPNNLRGIGLVEPMKNK